MQPYQVHPKSKLWTVVVQLTEVTTELPPSASLPFLVSFTSITPT